MLQCNQHESMRVANIYPYRHLPFIVFAAGGLNLEDCNPADIALSLCRMVSYNVAQVRNAGIDCCLENSTCHGQWPALVPERFQSCLG